MKKEYYENTCKNISIFFSKKTITSFIEKEIKYFNVLVLIFLKKERRYDLSNNIIY